MSDFDRFDFEENNIKNEQTSQDGAFEQKVNEGGPAEPRQEAPYQNVAYMPVMMPGERRSRRVKPAIVALIVAASLLFCTVCGLAGYLIADYLGERIEIGDGGGIVPNGTTGGGSTTEVNGMGDAPNYNFSAVTIPQNDGSALVGSTNGSAGANATTRIAAVAAVRDSVVEISTTTISNRGQLTAGAGSGVIIHADGIVVTNNHVIDGVSNIYVRLTNGNTYEAYLRGTDEENDIAILKITPKETLTVAKLGNSAALAQGEDVFAIGNPLGELGGTVTEGIISALGREVEMSDGTVMTLLQTSAAINSGNSGGGLFNMAGELIGVVNAKYSATGVEGLGFAIPIDSALGSINALLQYGYIQGRPSLGVTVADGTFKTGSGFFAEYRTFPYVYEAPSTSVLKANDIIYAVDGVAVSSVANLKSLIRPKRVGDTVTLSIYRDNQQTTVSVTLIEYVPQ